MTHYLRFPMMLAAPILLLWLGACDGARHPAPTVCPAPPTQPAAPESAASVPGAPLVDPEQRGETLVLQGTPPIPAALEERLNQYLDTRSAAASNLSTDARAMLVLTRFAQTTQVHLVGQPLGARRQLTFRSEPASGATFQPGNTDALIYISDQGGNEQYQIFRMELATGETTLLTDGRSRHTSYSWSHDGRQLAYNSNARNGKDMDIYIGDGRSPEAGKLVLERQGTWRPIDWSRDGKRLLLGEYVSINDSRLYVLDVATREVQRITPEQPRASYRDAVFDRSGRHVYAATDREGEFVALYRADIARGAWTPLTRDIAWNVEEVALAPSGRSVAFVVNEEGYGVLYLLDTRSGRYRKAPGVPRGVVSGISFARGTDVLAFTLHGPTSTGDAYTYDLRRGRAVRWTSSEIGGLNASKLIEPRLVRYETFDGRKIPAYYYAPPGDGPHPVLIWIHGGPESQARPYFSPVLQYLVTESKIAVLQPNVRGSDGYGKSYLLLDNGRKREDSVKDIGALIDWVARQQELDEGRVAVLGGSYGGYMVLASLARYAERLKAGVDIVGISNFVTFLENTKAYRRDLRRAEYGDERDPEMRAFLQRISPTTNAKKIDSALFVAHGANDPRVPLSETDQIVAAVREQGNEVWYMVAGDEGHGFRKKRNRDVFWQLSVLFIERQLLRERRAR